MGTDMLELCRLSMGGRVAGTIGGARAPGWEKCGKDAGKMQEMVLVAVFVAWGSVAPYRPGKIAPCRFGWQLPLAAGAPCLDVPQTFSIECCRKARQVPIMAPKA